MSGHQGAAGIPATRSVEAREYRSDPSVDDGDGAPWYRDGDRWLRAGMAGALVLALTLTDVGPAVLLAMVVVSAASTVRARRGGVVWWTALELVLYALIVVMVLTLTDAARALSGVELAAQLLVGALVGAGLVALAVTVRRRRAAPAGPPTAA
ncbi:hypothetical protein [Cellulomonas sp. S1-8]|uniref:hypothetical protein n=1 Tax=Cellulomonas sp. S1-8 TaxID=2904790 RepID=UPI00224472CE|nr:hypothetical protein [Cellulomonas sp. S1-8]UZN03441.1 hypothetical protein OKX07_00405 [Cellulomonas sp. S1-8]